MRAHPLLVLLVGIGIGIPVGMAVRPGSGPGRYFAGVQRPQGPVEDPAAVYRVPVGDSPSTGPASAPVTVVEVTDFQCPYCQKANATVRELKEKYGDRLRVVVKQYPLSMHQHAMLAAQAALAAHEQGKYFEMHHLLFEHRASLDRMKVEELAQRIGLDLARFRDALDSARFRESIEAEQRALTSLGVQSTPTFFVNGQKRIGALSSAQLEELIEEALRKADAAIAAGTKPEELYDELTRAGATRPVFLPSARQ